MRGIAIAVAAVAHVGAAAGADVKDLHFGEALYFAFQERYFEALERLDTEIAQHYGVDEPDLDSLAYHIDHAEFSVGDFELHYRMHHRAGRAIRAVLEGDVAEPVRNEAAYRLARIHLQKGQPADAPHALEGIRGEIPEDIRDDIEFLRANVYLATGRAGDAVEVLRGLQGSDELAGFSTYNLGIALLQDGRADEAIDALDRAGRVSSSEAGTLAIRDKSNLVLGTLLFEGADFGRAQQSLDRVRLEGPFSNQALLRAGWADASAEKFQRALVPWNILASRETTDAAVQEALLALPYAYSRLSVHGRAAVLYGRAVEVFGNELDKLDASLASIRGGAFLEALVREEIRQDKDWVIRLRSLPDAPETFYLMALMASHDFQTALQNYLDLEDLRKKLSSWRTGLDSFEDIVRLREQYYAPLLPDVDRRFRELDAQMRLRLEQRDRVDQRLHQLLIDERPELLATAAEQQAALRLERLEAALSDPGDPAHDELRDRIRRLRGAITWRQVTDFHERLTQAHDHLRELNHDVETLTGHYQSFVRSRQAATHGYVGYAGPIGGLRQRIAGALERLDVLMQRQGELLEAVATRELERRRERLAAYQNQARFAFADSYDRAAKAQAEAQ
jgi:hypothetical protein